MKYSYFKMSGSIVVSRCLSVFAILLLTLASANAQVTVEMKLDTADIVVGQQVQLSTIVSAPAQKHVQFPSYTSGKELMKGLEVIHQSDVDTTYLNNHQQVQLCRRYTVTSFDSALYNIPAMAVVVDADTFRATSSVGLKVNYVPVDTTRLDQFASPHAVVPEAYFWRSKLFLLSLVLWIFLFLTVVVSIRLTRRKPLTTKKVIKAQIPPFKQASTALEVFDVDQVREREDAKAFYVKLTDVLRVYIERRFDVPAMEKTTGELLSSLDGLVDTSELENLKLIFETADLVKFAKFMPSTFDMERGLTAAQNFLSDTKDEALEHPKPEVQIVVLNDGMQRKYRVLLWISLGILLLGAIAYSIFVTRSIYTTFF